MPFSGSVLYVRISASGWECSEDDREWRALPGAGHLSAVEAMEFAQAIYPDRMVAVTSAAGLSCPPEAPVQSPALKCRP